MICVVNTAGGMMDYRIERLSNGLIRVSQWHAPHASPGSEFIHDEERNEYFPTFEAAWTAVGKHIES